MQFEKTLIFLRKGVIFNKGRYSRTRQIVRGTFFFSILLNVNIVFGALALYYLYTIKLAYIWWLFYLLLSSFTIPSFLRRTSLRLGIFDKNIKTIYLLIKSKIAQYYSLFYKIIQNNIAGNL